MTEDLEPTSTLATGLAMFSMFFGAGNVVYPLALGQFAQDQNIFGILGFLLTGVGVPFMGLIAMTFYEGNYRTFFGRLGRIPGFVVGMIIMGLIGPFGALPRCIALAYSTVDLFFPYFSLQAFSLFSCIVIFLMTVKRNKIIDVLGYVLTPILLVTLIIIVIKGILMSPPLPHSSEDPLHVFLRGLHEGYMTMDLLGAFFFSSVVLICLKRPGENHSPGVLMIEVLKAVAIGASLLALVYIGFSFVAAFNGQSLQGLSSDKLLATIAFNVLGPYAGLIACVAVTLACLTTAVALAAVSSEYINEDLTFGKVPYWQGLILTLLTSYFVSTLQFSGILHFLTPILLVFYPALITLSFFNLLHKINRTEIVKLPVYAVFLLTLLLYGYS